MEKLVVMGGVGEDDTKGKVSLITTVIYMLYYIIYIVRKFQKLSHRDIN